MCGVVYVQCRDEHRVYKYEGFRACEVLLGSSCVEHIY